MTKYENLKQQILKMLADGARPSEIQRTLGISQSLYYYHVRSMDLVRVKRDDLKVVLDYFLENADKLPELGPRLEMAFDRLSQALKMEEEAE